MEQACAGCGYRSVNRDFFRREKSGIFRRKMAFCQGCAAYRPTRFERLSVDWAWMFITGALLVASGRDQPLRGIGYLWVFFGAVALFAVVTTIVHELGHAIAAHLVGMKVVSVVVGSGPILVARQWRDIRFELHTYVLMGGMTAAYHQIESPAKWRQGAMLLGGVGANLLLLMLGSGILILLATRLALSNPFVMAAFAVLASQIVAIIRDLWPHKLSGHQPARPSDGRQLVDLFRAKDFPRRVQEGRLYWGGMALLLSGRNAAAQVHFEQAHRLLPANGTFFALLVHSASKAAGPQAALRYYLQHDGKLSSENEVANAWLYRIVA